MFYLAFEEIFQCYLWYLRKIQSINISTQHPKFKPDTILNSKSVRINRLYKKAVPELAVQIA